MTIPRPARAYAYGEQAAEQARRGGEILRNPFPPETLEHDAWETGYQRAVHEHNQQEGLRP